MNTAMRRKRKKGHENHERWLVSYADLVTLLFAFFVVLFASTQSVAAMLGGKTKEKQAPASPLPEKPADPNSLQLDLPDAIRTLETTLGPEMKQGQVSVHLEHRGAVISLSSQSAFPSGGDTVSEDIYPLLAKVSKTLNQLPNPIRLEGNTDSLPINNERFRDNWALSAARSIAMLRILNERYGIGRERMAVVGYADTNPLADNSTEEGRMKNRRVDLVILSDYGKTSEPRPRTN
jgi:chemotaxis protein MotB